MIVDGYIRVSQVADRSGESFISSEVQREEIESWAKRHGVLVARVFEELDASGARSDRPLLAQAIARVEAGESQGIVVAYLSRFGRSLVDGITAIRRITDAGGSFISVEEDLDFSTDTGRLVLGFFLSIAEWELDRARSDWNVARERAVARGVFPGPTPYGYRRGPDGCLLVDRMKGPIVAELFHRRADGTRLVDLIGMLASRKIGTPKGKARWGHTTLRFLLARRVYLGEIRHGDCVNLNAHEALVDRETWERAQWPPEMRLPARGVAPPLLSGILRCAGCQRAMWSGVWDPGTSNGGRRYFCGHRSGDLACPERAGVRDATIEPFVEHVFFQQLARRGRRHGRGREARLAKLLAQRERELDAYRDNTRLVSVLGGERFARGLEVRVRRVEKARLELGRARLHPRHELPPVAELRERWPDMSVEQRRAAIATVIDCVLLKPGVRNIARRAHIYLRGRAPEDLPPACVPRTPPAERFDPSTAPIAVELEPVPDWGAGEVREALAPFLVGRATWPSFSEFQRAGLGRLYWHVERHGGPRHWAGLSGLPWLPPRAERDAWPEPRVRAELSEYLRNKAVWPTWSQFRLDGHGVLRDALKWSGGPSRWAEELGVELPPYRHEGNPWTYVRMSEEVAAFARGRHDWPTRAEFIAAGQANLYNAIQAAGVRDQLAAEIGLRVPPGRRVIRSYRWTEPLIQTILDEFLEGRTIWPSANEFSAAGIRSLRDSLHRAGTLETWAARYGLPVRRSSGQARPEPQEGAQRR